MEFLGVGPLELFFIILIALIILGPKDMVKAGRTIGRFLHRVVNSPTWQAIQQTSREMRYLPSKLIREAGLDEIREELPDLRTAYIDPRCQPYETHQPTASDHEPADWYPETIDAAPLPGHSAAKLSSFEGADLPEGKTRGTKSP